MPELSRDERLALPPVMWTPPDGSWIDCSVTLERVADGEARTFRDWLPRDDETGSASAWMYSDGNYSCDCNRWLDFERAGGGNPSLKWARCSDGAFLARIVTTDTGEIVYDERR